MSAEQRIYYRQQYLPDPFECLGSAPPARRASLQHPYELLGNLQQLHNSLLSPPRLAADGIGVLQASHSSIVLKPEPDTAPTARYCQEATVRGYGSSRRLANLGDEQNMQRQEYLHGSQPTLSTNRQNGQTLRNGQMAAKNVPNLAKYSTSPLQQQQSHRKLSAQNSLGEELKNSAKNCVAKIRTPPNVNMGKRSSYCSPARKISAGAYFCTASTQNNNFNV